MSVSLPVLGPTLETARLILRPPQPEDFEGWAAMMADEEVARFIGGAISPPVAWRTLAMMTGHWAFGGFSLVSGVEKGRGGWVGRLGSGVARGRAGGKRAPANYRTGALAKYAALGSGADRGAVGIPG